jgi:RNA polymerase sigma factor (sigma-70 family)
MSSPSLADASFQTQVSAAKQGDVQAIEALITGDGPLRRMYRSMIRKLDPEKIAARWEPRPELGGANEAEAAAHLGILEALQRFEPSMGVSFTTFAHPFIKGAVIQALYGKRYTLHGEALRPSTVQFDAPGAEDDCGQAAEADLLASDPSYGTESGYLQLVLSEEWAEVRSFVDGLPVNQREIANLHFFRGRSAVEIAAERGVSRQAVSKSLNTAFARGREQLADVAVAA